ncbi:MAG: transcriptional regulator, GntR family [Capsulimonas sp.]|jgi:GntR family transcriptional regulator|nr:transcriptional regulator, GntR family [Capsulimonas sp.]
MYIRLDQSSGSPLYLQIVDQVKSMIAGGALRAGDRLPTVRELASELVVNPNTIAHAYQHLERERVVETRRGLGSFVSAAEPVLSLGARRARVAALLDRALVEAHHVDLNADEIRALLEERMSEMADAERSDELASSK